MASDFLVTEYTYLEKKFLAAALFADGLLNELSVEKEDSDSLVGRIYMGVVDSVAKNISGAFVDIGRKELCFLSLGKESQIRPSTKIAVQITKDASGRKQPCATAKLSLTGKYAVISTGREGLSFSAKLNAAQKELLAKWIDREALNGFHILVRTNAAWADKASVNTEIRTLCEKLADIRTASQKADSYKLLYAPLPFYETMRRDLYETPDRVRTEIPRIAAEFGLAPYEDRKMPLISLYGLDHEIARLLQKTVWLKSGAFLVIEQTEAFTAVDVNSGKCTKGKIAEENYRRVNLEAAEEIARQLRLRNLSGMILVDFITLSNPDHNEELVNVMKKLVRRDHIHTEVADLTKLGILEIVRQKSSRPLAEILNG